MNENNIEFTIEKISEKIKLIKIGENYKSKCPFHDDAGDDDGSLIISPDRNIFHCFGCGESNSIEVFLEKLS